jgi:hypothetical protein
MALQKGGSTGRGLPSLDSDLQQIAAVWKTLLPAIQRAILAMIGLDVPGASNPIVSKPHGLHQA